jgi:hypothetical protein
LASTTWLSRTGAVISGSIVPILYSSENKRMVISGKMRTKPNQKNTVLKNASTTVTSLGPRFRAATPA